MPGGSTRRDEPSRGEARYPRSPEIQLQLDRLAKAFPVSLRHRKAFNNLGGHFVRAEPMRVRRSDYWVVLARFSPAIETTFGFTRELLIIYSDYPDLQARILENVAPLQQLLPRPVTPDVVFIYSPDERLVEKLDDWSTAHLLALPLPSLPERGDESAPILLNLIRQRIFTRDIYSETTPVSGDRFFGRQRLLQSLLDDVRSHRVVGLFGLRKSGKTSTLKELNLVLESERDSKYIFILRDLESLPSLPAEVVGPLVEDLRAELIENLQIRNLRSADLIGLGREYDLTDFRRAMKAMLRSLKEGVQIVIALDEVEYLCPPERAGLNVPSAQSIPQLFGVLRSLAQENSNFTFFRVL